MDNFKKLETFLSNRANNNIRYKIPTGFNQLDEYFKGGFPSGLIILGATPSVGKTTLCLQMANYMAKCENTKVLFFSLEMTIDELMAKTLSSLSYLGENYTEYSIDDFLYNNEIEQLEDITNEYKSFIENIEFVDEVKDFDEISETIDDFVDEYENERKIVLIDYLQYILFDERVNEKQAIDKILKRLKTSSKRNNITILLVSTLNRSSYYNKVVFSSFKETGGIEYTADILLGLNIRDEVRNEKELLEKLGEPIKELSLTILKYRSGMPDFTIDFDLVGAYATFEEV